MPEAALIPRQRCNGRDESGSADPPLGYLSPLHLVQAAPDAVGLTDANRVLEAVHPNRARLADRLGPLLALQLLLFAFRVSRWEKNFRLGPTACRLQLP